ncbi:Aspartyl/asparaginyl beta-hydroxylase [Portunus trituberculatus]|uniref:Aspartyl/asparaginyl beta-hydroxylase n=1 Tax=Portunus trituberculatus TaxID=210409 RepID=A0A5B7HNZ4_PORTR|nr:Aspartyl/asparaginyl beta-hydroxylase [Portunus trituberculatus]
MLIKIKNTYYVFFLLIQSHMLFIRKLEENWEVIRNEGVALLGLPVQDGFRPEAENLRDIGDWKQYELFTKGRKITANCVKAPRTCSLIEQFPAAAGCKRGQVMVLNFVIYFKQFLQ